MRQVDRRALIAGAALTALAAALPAAAAMSRPNILFALADDWSWQSAKPYDELGLKLPTFGRVKREGISFENAFAAAPTCTTSRGAILTGQAPWRLEEGANLASILPAKFGVYPEMLEKAGYHVGFSGKGWGPGQLKPVGRTRNPAGDSYKDFSAFMAARKPGQAFCFWFGSTDPHRPYKPGQGRADGVRLTGKLPPYLPDDEAVRGDVEDYMWMAQRFDRDLGAVLKQIEAAGELDNTLVVVTGDNGWSFPRGKATLYDAGTHVPLAMMWKARIKPGRTVTAPVILTDLAPTFLEAAGLPKPANMTASSLLPVMLGGKAPHASVVTHMERHMDGRTVGGQGYPMRALRNERYLFIRNFHPERWPAGNPTRTRPSFEALSNDVFSSYADIDGGPAKAFVALHHDDPKVARLYQLAMGKRPARELYDVKADPYQMTNLAGLPRYAKLAASLEAELMAELKRTGDPRLTQGDVFDRYPSYSDPGYGRPADLDVVPETGVAP